MNAHAPQASYARAMNGAGAPKLVVLVPVGPRHTRALQAMAADVEVTAGTGLPYPYPPDGAATFVGLALQARAQGTGYHLAILGDGRCVGICGIKSIDPTRRSGEIGYWLGRAHWGKGIGARAVIALCALARDELGLRWLTAYALESNTRSRRLLERCAFVPTRRERNAHRLLHRDPDEYLVFFERTLR